MIIVIRAFSRCFKKWHTMSISKFLCHVRRYLNCASQIAFISNQNPGYVIGEQMLLAFLDPQRQTMKTCNVCHIIHKHNSMYVPIIVLNHALPESLLPCCIPELDLKWSKGAGMEKREKTQIIHSLCQQNTNSTLRIRSFLRPRVLFPWASFRKTFKGDQMACAHHFNVLEKKDVKLT